MELGFEPGSRNPALNSSAHSRISIGSSLLGRTLDHCPRGAASSPCPNFPQAPPRTRPRPALPRELPLLPGLGGAGAGSGWLRVAAGCCGGSGCGVRVAVAVAAEGRLQRVQRRKPSGQRPPGELTPSEGAHPAPHLRVPAGLGRRRGFGEAPGEQRPAAGDASSLAPTQLGPSGSVNGARAGPRAPLGTRDGTIW